MRPSKIAALLVALALAIPAQPLRADPADLPPECQRFATETAWVADLGQRLARLCIRLVAANTSAAGLTAEETEAATRLGQYLAVLAQLEMRLVPEDGVMKLRGFRRISDAARYLIANEMGLIALADELAPGV